MRFGFDYRRFIGGAPEEERMGTWALVVDVIGPVAVGLLLIALGWAALERGRVHHFLARRRSKAGQPGAADVGARGGNRLLVRLFSFAHRTRRIHIAVGAVAGCV
jgi:hypothetical protein